MNWRSKAATSVFTRRVSELLDLGSGSAPPAAINRVELVLRHVARVAIRSDRGWHGLGEGGITVLLDHAMPWAPQAVGYFDAGVPKRVAAPQWLMMGPELDIIFGVSHDWTVLGGPIDPTFYLLPAQTAAQDLYKLYSMAYATLRQLANIADPLQPVAVKEPTEEPNQGD